MWFRGTYLKDRFQPARWSPSMAKSSRTRAAAAVCKMLQPQFEILDEAEAEAENAVDDGSEARSKWIRWKWAASYPSTRVQASLRPAGSAGLSIRRWRRSTPISPTPFRRQFAAASGLVPRFRSVLACPLARCRRKLCRAPDGADSSAIPSHFRRAVLSRIGIGTEAPRMRACREYAFALTRASARH